MKTKTKKPLKKHSTKKINTKGFTVEMDNSTVYSHKVLRKNRENYVEKKEIVNDKEIASWKLPKTTIHCLLEQHEELRKKLRASPSLTICDANHFFYKNPKSVTGHIIVLNDSSKNKTLCGKSYGLGSRFSAEYPQQAVCKECERIARLDPKCAIANSHWSGGILKGFITEKQSELHVKWTPSESSTNVWTEILKRIENEEDKEGSMVGLSTKDLTKLDPNFKLDVKPEENDITLRNFEFNTVLPGENKMITEKVEVKTEGEKITLPSTTSNDNALKTQELASAFDDFVKTGKILRERAKIKLDSTIKEWVDTDKENEIEFFYNIHMLKKIIKKASVE